MAARDFFGRRLQPQERNEEATEGDQEVADAVHAVKESDRYERDGDDVGEEREDRAGPEFDVEAVVGWQSVDLRRDRDVVGHAVVEQHHQHVRERTDRDQRRARQAPVARCHDGDADQPDEVDREWRGRDELAE